MAQGQYMVTTRNKRQRCEVCGRKATQADTCLNMWLCDDHYSAADPDKLSDEAYEKLEFAYNIAATFGGKRRKR